MKETTKATKRRSMDRQFHWEEVMAGTGLDIGCGDDPLPGCIPFDKEQGDAQYLKGYFPSGRFNFVHSSHCLEHMKDPVAAFSQWLAVLKPKGYAVIVVPDFVLYEQLHWPSIYNSDHKSTWSMHLKGTPSHIHCLLPEWLLQFKVWVHRCELVDTNYKYSLLGKEEQTWAMAEAGIEFVVQV